MSTASEIVRVLRLAGGKLSGRDIHNRGSFHDLETTLKVLQELSQPKGVIEREKPGNSSTFVYGMRAGASLPIDIADELREEAPAPKSTPAAPSAETESKPSAPVKASRSGAKLHEHLFKTLEELEAGTIDHIQAKARAMIADQIIKLANVQLLYEQLKQSQQIHGDLTDMPLIESREA